MIVFACIFFLLLFLFPSNYLKLASFPKTFFSSQHCLLRFFDHGGMADVFLASYSYFQITVFPYFLKSLDFKLIPSEYITPILPNRFAALWSTCFHSLKNISPLFTVISLTYYNFTMIILRFIKTIFSIICPFIYKSNKRLGPQICQALISRWEIEK